MRWKVLGLALFLAGCANRVALRPSYPAPLAPIEVQILALNDFHGNLLPSGPVTYSDGQAPVTAEMQGGIAQLGAALAAARTAHSITVAAGDLIGASPLESAAFLDEPAIAALGLIGLDLAAVGNHEFDKGSRELSRMQAGGCATFTTRKPCRLEVFSGAKFRYLAANVLTEAGVPLFAPTAIRQFGPIRIGFIGMTLKDTATLVTPSGVAGLTFTDEAATANALVPALKAQGADTIVLLFHQGAKIPETYRTSVCAGATGAILPLLDRLDPAIRTVVSGHTHNAYACQIERGGTTRLLTSAGKYGYFYSDLRLRFDPATHALIDSRAVNVPVPGDGARQLDVAALVDRYLAAAKPEAERVVGRLAGPVLRSETYLESPLADLIADAQLHATRRRGAQIAFTNVGGVRTDLVPRADGSVDYGQLFALQPFGNGLVIQTLTGAQLKALLEQQFAVVDGVTKVKSLLAPSRGFAFRYNLSRPEGTRIVSMLFDGRRVSPGRRYRVTVNSFLATGGDGFSVFATAIPKVDAGTDLDALEAWVMTGPDVPKADRIREN